MGGGGEPPSAAVPIEYSFRPETACMEGVLGQMPDTLRRAVAPYVDLDRLPENRWYLERMEDTFTFLAVGDPCSVLASCQTGGSPIRRVFTHGRLRQRGPDDLPANPVAGPGATPARLPIEPDDVPAAWVPTFAQLPHRSQRLFESTFPPGRRATRYPGACMDADRSRERIWLFAGTKTEVLLVHAARSVPVDPVSSRSTETRLRAAPWSVTAWRGAAGEAGGRLPAARE